MTTYPLDRAALDALYAAFNFQFSEGMQKSTALYKTLAMTLESRTAIENYPIFDQFDGMREWLGPRKLDEINLKMLQIKNRTFEKSVRVNRDAIADEQCGLFGALIAALGANAENLWDDLIFDALCSPGNWIDGNPFFYASRRYGKQALCNTTDNPLSPESYADARSAMMGYRGHGNQSLCVMPNLLIVGPSNESMAKSIVEAQLTRQTQNGTAITVDNLLRNTAQLIVSPRLSGIHAGKWFLADTHDIIKPIILQQREKPMLTRLDSDENEHVFTYNEFIYGTRARGAAALAVPHLIYGGGRV